MLGRLADFPDGNATPAAYQVGGQEIALVVVRRGTALHAYLDLCPHLFLPLTYRGGQVLSADGERLRCTSHGAEFAVSDGRALSGPGNGCGLSPVPLCVNPDGIVAVADTPGPAPDGQVLAQETRSIL